MLVTRSVLLCIAFFGLELVFLGYALFLYYPEFTSVSSTSRENYQQLTSVQLLKVSDNNGTFDLWFSTFLLILVPIRPFDIHSRQLVRNTWFKGFENSSDVAMRFVMGGKSMGPDKHFELSEENGTYGDIILIDTVESGSALTNKTLGLINWAHRHVQFSYLMKCDDDTYVFVNNMITELRQRPTTTKLYYGKMLRNSPPIRGKYKWADNEWDLSPVFLPFAMGGGYVLSHDLVAILSEATPKLKWHVNEDTAIGAWISAFDHERKSSDKFCSVWKGTNYPKCQHPLLAYLLFGFSRSELTKQFHHFQEQVNSNTKIITMLAPPTAAAKSEGKPKPKPKPK